MENEYAAINTASPYALKSQLSGGVGVPRQPLMAEFGSRLGELQSIIGESNNDLASLRTRLLGSWPQTDGAANSAKSDGIGADLIQMLDRLIFLARDVRENAAALNSGV